MTDHSLTRFLDAEQGDSDPAETAEWREALRQEATMGDEGWTVDRQVLAMPQGLRWTDPDNWHITLCFYGSQPNDHTDLTEHLAQAAGLGETLRARNVPVGRVLSSRWCRAST